MMNDDCKHPAYRMEGGNLKCVNCGAVSESPKWPGNVFGQKAVEQGETENKGRFWPSESKRLNRLPSGKFAPKPR